MVFFLRKSLALCQQVLVNGIQLLRDLLFRRPPSLATPWSICVPPPEHDLALACDVPRADLDAERHAPELPLVELPPGREVVPVVEL